MERQTRQRHAVSRALQESGRSLSPPEILAMAQRDVPSLSLSTVYRQLKSLVGDGAVAAVELPGQPPRFEMALRAAACPPGCHAHGEHHHDLQGRPAPGSLHRHHFHCLACDQVFPIEGCPGGIEQLVPAGWTVERHDLTLHGRCPACLGTDARA
jgi:Fur family ferric uptake transcriptional regulator